MKILCLDKTGVHLKRIELTKEQVGSYGNLMDLLRAQDLPVGSSCKGAGVCGWCRVKILQGAEALPELTSCEDHFSQSDHEFTSDFRLSCQVKPSDIEENSTIEITTNYW